MASASDASRGSSNIAPVFVIGITGHRDIPQADWPNVRQALKGDLSRVKDHLPTIPVRLTTGLAEGADTLAAEVALELGVQVDAVLPMPLADYRSDFEGAALERFDALVANPSVTVREIPPADGVAADLNDAAARDRQYALLGDYLVRRSNLLIAIWDGKDAGLVGGTSDVLLRYLGDARDIRPNRITVHDSSTEGCGNVVCWIPCNRVSDGAGAASDTSCYLISNANYDCYWQTSTLPDQILTRWSGFDAFYTERMSDYGSDLAAYGLAQSDDDFGSGEPQALDAEFMRADQLARAYQGQSHWMFALFGLLAAGMGLVFLIYAKLLADKTFLWVYIVLFVVGFLGFRVTHRRHLHSKHLAYRALAETYRIQFFLILSGAGEGYNARRMLGLTSVDQFQRFEWLQEAIRVAEPLVYAGHCEKGDALDLVRNRWIGDQLGYFDKKRHQLHQQHHRLETMKFALLIGSVIGALALIYFKKTLIHLDMMGYDGKAWLVFFMGLLPLWAAIWELYQGKMATRELLWQYANQSRYFRAAHMEIEQAPNLADGQKTIRDLADKALIEIYIWCVHRFHREHEPPAAG